MPRGYYWRISVLVFLITIPVILICMPMDWLTGDESRTFCLYTIITGHHCWGCGLTRAVTSVMHGEFREAWGYNNLIVIVFPMLLWFWARWIWKLWRQIRRHGKAHD